MLNLNDKLLLFKGNIRNVYQHPDDDGKCIKIIHNTSRKRSVERETRYLQKYRREGKPFDRLPQFYGWTTTNIGRGGVFDLIRDYHGGISKTLSYHVVHKPTDRLRSVEIATELLAMRTYFIENDIIICDPAPHNIAVQRITDNSFRFVIVDGIGNPLFLKFGDYISSFARRQILKKWKYYIEDNQLLQDVLARGKYTYSRLLLISLINITDLNITPFIEMTTY